MVSVVTCVTGVAAGLAGAGLTGGGATATGTMCAVEGVTVGGVTGGLALRGNGAAPGAMGDSGD